MIKEALFLSYLGGVIDFFSGLFFLSTFISKFGLVPIFHDTQACFKKVMFENCKVFSNLDLLIDDPARMKPFHIFQHENFCYVSWHLEQKFD